MPRRENPIDPADGPVAQFALDLRAARAAAGNPTYRAMAERAHCSAPALSTAAAGKTLPTWAITRAFLRACNISLADKDVAAPWQMRWQAARLATASVEVDLATVAELAPRQNWTTRADEQDRSWARPPAGLYTTGDYAKALGRLRRQRRITIREIEAE